jgi:hypothetical protein
MVPLVLVIAGIVAVGVVSTLHWPWWAGVLIYLVATPAVAAGIAVVARQLGLTGQLLRSGGPPIGSPGHAVHEAFIDFAEANRQGDYERATQVWAKLEKAATAANATSVLDAMDAVAATSGVNFDESLAKAAVHRLRLAIDDL